MNIKLRYKLIAIMSTLLAVFCLGRCGRMANHKQPIVLPQNDKEQIIIDPVKHHLIIVDDKGQTVTTLPDRPSIIDVHKDGTVQVTAPQFGLEHRFFFGFQMSNAARFAAGVDGFYWKKLDLGAGLACQVGIHNPVIFVKASYVVYDNFQLGATYDNNRQLGIIASLRI